jgi:peptidoglycan/LPS O-acetylase OafA/YrhL
LGVISYGIYLWHADLITQFLKWGSFLPHQVPFWALAVAITGISIAFASASYFVVERPLLRLKGRIPWWDRPPPAPSERSHAAPGSRRATAVLSVPPQ